MQTHETHPLDQLRLSELNPRKVEPTKKEIAELAYSIDAIGLQQNLIGYPEGDFIEVVGGGRRFRALKWLADEGKIGHDHPVQVAVHDTAEAAAEAAIAENEARKNMTAVDQFHAFQAQRTAGVSVPRIAAAFATDQAQVMRILALDGLAPDVMGALAAGELSLDQARAFLADPDQERQSSFLTAWVKGGKWPNEPDAIRRRIREVGQLGRLERRLQFVGLDAYKAAGGQLVQDLFSRNVAVKDPEILEKCVAIRAEAWKAEMVADGWAWAELVEGNEAPKYQRRLWGQRILREEDADRLAALEEIEEPSEEEEAEYEAIQERASALGFTEDQKSVAGVVMLTDGYQAFEPWAHIRQEDMARAADLGVIRVPSPGSLLRDDQPKKPPLESFSDALSGELRSVRTVAVANIVAERPELALDLLAWLMSEQAYYVSETTIRGTVGNLGAAASLGVEPAFERVEPADRDHLALRDFQAKGKKHRNDVLARWVAQSLQADTQYQIDRQPWNHWLQIEVAANVAVRKTWTPDEKFFVRLTSAQLIALHVLLAGCKPREVDERKGTLVAALTALFADPAAAVERMKLQNGPAVIAAVKSWLPQPLKSPVASWLQETPAAAE
jgi:ParB family chromosome partitioning protein